MPSELGTQKAAYLAELSLHRGQLVPVPLSLVDTRPSQHRILLHLSNLLGHHLPLLPVHQLQGDLIHPGQSLSPFHPQSIVTGHYLLML